MEFSRHEYWSGLPFPSPGHLPNPRIGPKSPTLHAGFFVFFFNRLSHQGSLETLGGLEPFQYICSKEESPVTLLTNLMFIGFCILIFLFSSCPSLGAVILCRMVAFLNLFSQATNMIVNVDLDNIVTKMPRSQPTHPAPEAEVVRQPQVMGCGKRKAGEGLMLPEVLQSLSPT